MTERVIYLKLNEALKRIQKHIPVENIFGIFLLDTYDEITEINTSIVAPGSTCFVIDTSEYYMLNTEDEWIKVNLYGDLESIKTEI